MTHMKNWTCLFFCLAVTMLAAAELPYDLELDVEFIQKLGELELNDYADLQLKQMAASYPKQQELIGLERARFFYATGNSKQADAAVAAIRKDSPFYPQALILKGQVHAARRRFNDAEKTFQEYFAMIPTAPKRRADREDFKRAIRIFNTGGPGGFQTRHPHFQPCSHRTGKRKGGRRHSGQTSEGEFGGRRAYG